MLASTSIVHSAKSFLRRYIGTRLGYRPDFSLEKELSAAEANILEAARPYTKTSFERLITLIRSIQYICECQIPGDVIECGVWEGGSMMAAALALQEFGDTTRELYLFDTFAEVPDGTAEDIDILGRSASFLKERAKRKNQGKPTLTASLEAVRTNLLSTGYPEHKIHFVKGMVEDTIPCDSLSSLAFLRLDTDLYRSTLHELTHLFPLLSTAGILLIDDYGHWQGARRAIDEYFAKHKIPIFLHRIDYTGRAAVKCCQV